MVQFAHRSREGSVAKRPADGRVAGEEMSPRASLSLSASVRSTPVEGRVPEQTSVSEWVSAPAASASAWGYEVALALCAAIWGGSFVVLKGAITTVAPGWLMVIRFGAAAVLLAAYFWRRLARNLDGSHVVAGVAAGIPMGLGYLIQNIGLVDISPGRSAFLTATYCVIVPFLNWMVVRRRPAANNTAAAALALCGVGLLALDVTNGDLALFLSGGDWLTLGSALCFALNIVIVGRIGGTRDSVTFSITTLVVMALVSLVYAVPMETPPKLTELPTTFWLQLLYLVLLATVYATLAQTVGQRHVEPAKASLLLSMESVFTVLFSVVFYGEELTVQLSLGFLLILAAVLVSELPVARRRRKMIA